MADPDDTDDKQDDTSDDSDGGDDKDTSDGDGTEDEPDKAGELTGDQKSGVARAVAILRGVTGLPDTLRAAVASLGSAAKSDDDSADADDKDGTEKSRGDDEMAKDTVSKSDVQSIVDLAVKKAGETQAAELLKRDGEISELRKNLESRDVRQHIVEKKWGGEVDTNVALAQKMRDVLPEADYEAWIEREDAAAKILTESDLLREVGKSHAPAGSATEGLVSKAVEMSKDGKSYDEIVAAVDVDAYSAMTKEQEAYARNRD